ncbi:MAG: hypothetical protein LUG89_01755 [Methanosphaera sp.]|nr:hypothetical protein [Methanosphaera sp.]
MDLENIEFWEHEYLEQIYFLLKNDEKIMRDGFRTKEEIRSDWEQFLGNSTSDFATGAERIFYNLFNNFGKPISSPIGSDLFFETYNAYVHIDIKTVTLKNIGDFHRNIFVGDNQNSYKGNITYEDGHKQHYEGNLPTFYSKTNGDKKICLTYFIGILYNQDDLHINVIFLSCMPNGELSETYEPDVLSAGKNKGKIRFNYTSVDKFKLLNDHPSRTKILLFEPEDSVKSKLKELEEIYTNQ